MSHALNYSILTLHFPLSVQQPNLSHPFHLHGHSFKVIGIGRSPDKNIKKINLKHALDLDRRGLLHRQFNLPPAKDTIAVPNNGYVVLRFRADNPGKLALIWAGCWVLKTHIPLPKEIVSNSTVSARQDFGVRVKIW